jgi:6,7-dimethyl-8-ribityllumazine synthase
MMRVLIVEARFYPEISDALYDGAAHALDLAGVSSERIAVPGALEIPAAIRLAAKHFDGFIALGCVIRGETYHFEVVAGESARGLMELMTRATRCIATGSCLRRAGAPPSRPARELDRRRCGARTYGARAEERFAAMTTNTQTHRERCRAPCRPGRSISRDHRHRARRGHREPSSTARPRSRPGRRFTTGLLRRPRARRAEASGGNPRAASGWTPPYRLILRAPRSAAYELVARRDVPAKVVIDEHVELRDFFGGMSPAHRRPRRSGAEETRRRIRHASRRRAPV